MGSILCLRLWQNSYEKMMTRYLASHYDVKSITLPQQYSRRYRRVRYAPWLVKNLVHNCLQEHFASLKHDDVVVVHDAGIKGFTQQLITQLDCRKVLLIRNPTDSAFVEKVRPLFDKIASFEQNQCQSLDIDYLPQFIPIGFHEAQVYSTVTVNNNQRRSFFLGRDKGRAEQLATVAQHLIGCGRHIDFSIVRDKSSHLSSEFYVDEELDYGYSLFKTITAEVLVDIVQQGQTGWTLRVLEALYFNKKIVTNNVQIINSDFYCAQRFFIIGHDAWHHPESFLNAPVEPIMPDKLYAFSPDSMLMAL